MFCPNCGVEISDNSKFCFECGEAVAVDINRDAAQINYPPEEENRGDAAPRRYTRSELREYARKNPDEYYFDPQSYGEPQPFDGVSVKNIRTGYDDVTSQVSAPKSRAPYTVVSIAMALLGALNLLFPFLKCFTLNASVMGYQLSDEKISIFDLFMNFLKADKIFTFITGSENDYGLSDYIPSDINNYFNLLRIGMIAAAGVFVFTMILWIVFVILSLARAKGASGFGISAAVITIITDAAILYGVSFLSNIVNELIGRLGDIIPGKYAISPTPLAGISITICAAVFVLCVTAAVLRKRLRRN